MFFSIVKWTIISLTLIFLVHHLYSFLMNTLTVPKIKDLVNKPKEQYNDILQTMHKGTNAKRSDINKQSTDNSMTDELSSFLNDLKKTGGEQVDSANIVSAANIVSSANISGANISSASDFNSGNAFSTF